MTITIDDRVINTMNSYCSQSPKDKKAHRNVLNMVINFLIFEVSAELTPSKKTFKLNGQLPGYETITVHYSKQNGSINLSKIEYEKLS